MTQVNPPATPAAVMESFFTRSRANEGIELPLYLPSGEKTAHHIRIRGIDSDAFKAEEAESRRRLLEIAATDLNKAVAAGVAQEEKLSCISALVMSWSFDAPCTRENVRKFLIEAPQIANQIDMVASKRQLFFRPGLPSSSPTPGASSS